jgi:arginine decarboxylase
MSAGDDKPDWTTEQSLELYSMQAWGAGYFGIADSGNVVVRPQEDAGPEIDLLGLVRDLRHRGLRTPMLLRFSDILKRQIERLQEAFRLAIDEQAYAGAYRGVYPIKVNQQRHVVEEIVQLPGVGLEAGSKPELLVALALLDDPEALIICNGFKDRAYVETALLAQRLGRTPMIVVDRYEELELIMKSSRELGIRPHIGVRARLSAQGSGRWHESSGRRSKFGLSPMQLIKAVERLRAEDMLDCLELLHFHIGSQITSIRAHKDALREASRIYVGLHALGAERLHVLDIGGGLGVDYDGSKTDFHSSINYSVQEYANDVIDAVRAACDESNVGHPDIVSESGRAMVAHHSVLIFDVIGADQMLPHEIPDTPDADDDRLLRDLAEVHAGVTPSNLQESYHNALELREQATSRFALGYLDLPSRAWADQLFFACCHEILRHVRLLESVPEDLLDLEKDLSDTYFGNFSVFQSAPDHWAIKQLFPVMPIHRLDEEPTHRAVFADLTCDSDGKIDRFIDLEDEKSVIELHPFDGSPYFLGVFMVGAYQEILGDLHNLFGDTDAVHVRLDDQGGYEIEHVVEGDAVSDVLSYVQYDCRALIEKVRRTIEIALRKGKISLEDSALLRRRYEQGLREYTYLSDDD